MPKWCRPDPVVLAPLEFIALAGEPDVARRLSTLAKRLFASFEYRGRTDVVNAFVKNNRELIHQVLSELSPHVAENLVEHALGGVVRQDFAKWKRDCQHAAKMWRRKRNKRVKKARKVRQYL